MRSAKGALMPTRTLQTWQMTLACWLRSLIFCSSQKPISRRRCVTSLGAESCLIRTAVPARTLLSGQMKGWRHSDSTEDGSLIVGELTSAEMELQESMLILGAVRLNHY